MSRLILRRAIVYYVVMLGVFSAVECVYLTNPFFQKSDYQFFVDVYVRFFNLFLLFGLPYYLIEGAVYSGLFRRRLPLVTIPTVLLLILRRIGAGLSSKKPRHRPSWSAFLTNHHIRNRLLGFVIKAYFGALMITFAHYHYRTVVETWQKSGHRFGGFDSSYVIVYHSLFIVDAGLATIGYYCESALLGNRLRSVDPYPMSWMVTLACYPPFNEATGTWLPLRMSSGCQIGLPAVILIGLKIGAICCYAAYVWATLALNIKFSNLTHRGVVQSGPYALVRHPAYCGKNLAWWLEYLPYIRNGANILPLMLWNLIYILRAIYEEKHLSADPEYREYMKKVRFRFIPHVV